MFDLTLHYNEENHQLYIEPEWLEGEVYENVSREDIPNLVQEFLRNLLTNHPDVL
jgi:hypothetical protein